MKKLFQAEKWKRHSQSRARAEKKRRKRWHNRRRDKAIKASGERAIRHSDDAFQRVIAPENFSFVNNAREIIEFLRTMHRHFVAGNRVLIDLENVKKLSSDAIAVLVASLRDKRFTRGLNFVGNEPKDPALAKIFKESGFYSHFRALTPNNNTLHGGIFKRKGKMVELSIISEMIEFSTTALYGKRVKNGAVWRILIECMANTKDHAASTSLVPESWWATVFHDRINGKVCFSFIDLGVGIFGSLKMRKMAYWFKSILGLQSNCDILREIVSGTLGSRTKIPYRGKGLPSIYKAFLNNQVSRLVIISNDVYADFSTGTFSKSPRPFVGTFLYWELKGQT